MCVCVCVRERERETYTVLKGVMNDHIAIVRNTDELVSHNLQALCDARLSSQGVKQLAMCWLPQGHKACTSAGHQVAPMRGLELM